MILYDFSGSIEKKSLVPNGTITKLDASCMFFNKASEAF